MPKSELVFSLQKFILYMIMRDEDVAELLIATFLTRDPVDEDGIELYRSQGKTINEFIENAAKNGVITLACEVFGIEFILKNYFVERKDYVEMTYDEALELCNDAYLTKNELDSLAREGKVTSDQISKLAQDVKIE